MNFYFIFYSYDGEYLIFNSRTVGVIVKKRQKFYADEFIALSLPLSMFLFGNLSFEWSNVKTILIIWNCIIFFGSLTYSMVALSTGHHDPKNVHEGDEFKSLDYGLYQLATTIERVDAGSNLFISLAYFGDHILHHFFPSLDHAVLPQLQVIFEETCKDFNEEIRECTMIGAVIGQFKQLARTETICLV